MKPTEQEISDAAKEAGKNTHGEYPTEARVHYRVGFIDGVQWAISQMQPEWIPVQRTPELITRLENTDARLIQCLFDTGEILAFNDDHPFAIMTHYCFLPQPPIKKP